MTQTPLPVGPVIDKGDRILDAALVLMAARGAAGTSMRQVATACNRNVATIYHYFPSKAFLLRSILEERRTANGCASTGPGSTSPTRRANRLVALIDWLRGSTPSRTRRSGGSCSARPSAVRRPPSPRWRTSLDLLAGRIAEWLRVGLPEPRAIPTRSARLSGATCSRSSWSTWPVTRCQRRRRAVERRARRRGAPLTPRWPLWQPALHVRRSRSSAHPPCPCCRTGTRSSSTGPWRCSSPTSAVRALWVHGSVGRNEADASSDLDLILAVADEDFDDLWGTWSEWLARITPTVIARPLPWIPGILYALTPECLRIDVVVERVSALPTSGFGDAALVFDRDGLDAQVPAPPVPPGPDRASVETAIEEPLRYLALLPALLDRHAVPPRAGGIRPHPPTAGRALPAGQRPADDGRHEARTLPGDERAVRGPRGASVATGDTGGAWWPRTGSSARASSEVGPPDRRPRGPSVATGARRRRPVTPSARLGIELDSSTGAGQNWKPGSRPAPRRPEVEGTSMSTLKVWIDQDLCTGDGICVELQPGIFAMHDDGLAYVKEAGWSDIFNGSGTDPVYKMAEGTATCRSRTWTPRSRPPRSAPASASSWRSSSRVTRRVDAGGLRPRRPRGRRRWRRPCPTGRAQLAAGDEPEVERVEVALHGDVEALAVDDRRHRVVVQQLGARRRRAAARGPGTFEITRFTGEREPRR